MDESFRKQIEGLKSVLLKLAPTGENGFEGLIAVTLNKLTGVPFRLAGSGSQFGVDAKPAYESDSICFEAKRYDDAIPREKILSKLAELSSDVDLWVLGTTSRVPSQLVDNIRDRGHKDGISTLIVDWTDIGLPPLAVALAMTEAAAVAFLKSRVGDQDLAAAKGALKAILDSEGFTEHAARLQSALAEPSLGVGIARRTNREWLTKVFSNKQQARRFLGQPLAPQDLSGGTPLTRETLVGRTRLFLTDGGDGKIVAVLGDEGNGKSWLVAQSWLCLEEKPLMVVFTADDFVQVNPADDLKDIIIDKLMRQTGEPSSEGSFKRWRRKLERWRNRDAGGELRLVVFIDGLNQRPRTDWARLLEALTDELNQIGGRLIVTARTPYFRERIEQRLFSPFVEIEVPKWSETERDEILAAHDITGSDLHAAVAKSLKNPRLLGIALGLLEGVQIKDLTELSVSRLFFEHMRTSEQDAPSPPAHEFARKLQAHANEILKRIDERQSDDLKIFDGGLEAASGGRFFVAVEGDPTRYTLAADGLTLALGFSVLDKLRVALRSERDLDEALDAIIEPISALDQAAEVIMAALTVSCIEKRYPVEIAAAVVRAFAGTQNPNTDHISAFGGLARQHPKTFLIAAHDLCLAGGHQANFDWIEVALHAAKSDDRVWPVISEHLRSWLASYSLSTERGVFLRRSREPAEKLEAERARKQKKIVERLRLLSSGEKKLLESLTEVKDGSLGRLARFALMLMAGKPIAPFATALAQWSFASALNADTAAPYKEFIQLVRFNRVDWQDARAAILESCRVFEEQGASDTGKWALVKMLRATGHAADGARVDELVAKLLADKPRFEGWRLVEKYCSTDPCDPGSERPENIADTARNYEAIDVSKIRLGRDSSAEDHFFVGAGPGVARFEPDVAIKKHREFIAEVFGRQGLLLRQGFFELRHHNALLTQDEAFQLVRPSDTEVVEGNGHALHKDDEWIVSQYRLLLAFPLLTAQQQIETLLSQALGNGILVELTEVMKPLDDGIFESLLEKACRDGDECAQYRVLVFGGSTETVMSEGARNHLAALISSESERVRAAVLCLIAKVGDEQLIEKVVESEWSAARPETDEGYEMWYGSAVILEAAARDLIPLDQALDRMAPEFYGRAAKRLNADAVKAIAERIGASIVRAADRTIDSAVPDIEIAVQNDRDAEPVLYSVSEKPSHSDDPFEALKRFTESEAVFGGRQKRVRKAFDAFKAELTQTKVRIILDRLGIDEFDAIAASHKKLVEDWYEMFVKLPKDRLAIVHNLGLLLAHALSAVSPEKAVRLFSVLSNVRPFVRIRYGYAGIDLARMTIWSTADDPHLDGLRFERLDRSENDHALAFEVLAALWNSKEALLRSYMEKQLDSGEPARISRALMVAGLSVHSEFSDEILGRYQDTPGFIGSAQAAAMYAYERNKWAEHWFKQMQEAERPEDFWRHSILFTKIVDGRFDVWQDDGGETSELFRMFWPSVESKLGHRLKKWQGHRERKLFGDDAPAPIFLHE